MSETNYTLNTNNLNVDLSEIIPAYNQYNQTTYNDRAGDESGSVSITQSGGIPYYIVLPYYIYNAPSGSSGTYDRFEASNLTGSVMIQYNSSTNFSWAFNKQTNDTWNGSVNFLTLAFDKNNTTSSVNSSITTNYLVNNGNYVNKDLTQIFPTFEQGSSLNFHFFPNTGCEGTIYLSNNKTNTTDYYIIPSMEWISGTGAQQVYDAIKGINSIMIWDKTSTSFNWSMYNNTYDWIGNINFLIIYNTN
jgi:hypothetical protein